MNGVEKKIYVNKKKKKNEDCKKRQCRSLQWKSASGDLIVSKLDAISIHTVSNKWLASIGPT